MAALKTPVPILALEWTLRTDFLLHEWGDEFDFVVGNPPYVRLEAMPVPVLRHYRENFHTVTDRADLYIPLPFLSNVSAYPAIEPTRLLPLLLAQVVCSDKINWSGQRLPVKLQIAE